MPRLTRIYTRTGDDGSTSLTDGQRVPKSALRIEVYGTVDELNSIIGLAISSDCLEEVDSALRRVQNELFHLGADLSLPDSKKENRPGPSVGARHVEALEREIDRFSRELPQLENFILPGGCQTAATLHLARTMCRRAERLAVSLGKVEPIGEWVLRYLNRLSDFLFTAARVENYRRDVPEILWDSRS